MAPCNPPATPPKLEKFDFLRKINGLMSKLFIHGFVKVFIRLNDSD